MKKGAQDYEIKKLRVKTCENNIEKPHEKEVNWILLKLIQKEKENLSYPIIFKILNCLQSFPKYKVAMIVQMHIPKHLVNR